MFAWLAVWSTTGTYNFPKKGERERHSKKKFERAGKTFDFLFLRIVVLQKKTLLTFSPPPSFRGWISQLFSAFSPFWAARRGKRSGGKSCKREKSSFFFGGEDQ